MISQHVNSCKRSEASVIERSKDPAASLSCFFAHFIHLLVLVSVLKKIGIGKSIGISLEKFGIGKGIGLKKNWYRKKYRYRFRKFVVSKKVSVLVSKIFGIDKSIGIGFEKMLLKRI